MAKGPVQQGGLYSIGASTETTLPSGYAPQTIRIMPSANINYEAQNAKVRAINETVSNTRKTYDIKHKRVERLRCVSAAFKEARHIELNQDCQKVIDGINHMSGLDKQYDSKYADPYYQINQIRRAQQAAYLDKQVY